MRGWHTRLSDYRQYDIRRVAAGAKNALRRRDVIRIARQEDVRHILLRVTVVNREPGAVDLHHYSMAFQERVIVGVQVDGVWHNLIRRNWFWLDKRITKAAAQNFI